MLNVQLYLDKLLTWYPKITSMRGCAQSVCKHKVMQAERNNECVRMQHDYVHKHVQEHHTVWMVETRASKWGNAACNTSTTQRLTMQTCKNNKGADIETCSALTCRVYEGYIGGWPRWIPDANVHPTVVYSSSPSQFQFKSSLSSPVCVWHNPLWQSNLLNKRGLAGQCVLGGKSIIDQLGHSRLMST